MDSITGLVNVSCYFGLVCHGCIAILDLGRIDVDSIGNSIFWRLFVNVYIVWIDTLSRSREPITIQNFETFGKLLVRCIARRRNKSIIPTVCKYECLLTI